jgi:apolipoprotein N-acyltransferase
VVLCQSLRRRGGLLARRGVHIRPNLQYAYHVQIILTLLSAVLLPLALPNELFPWGVALPGLVALTPVLIAVYRAGTVREATRLGALFGIVSTAIGNYWLAFFGDFSVWTIGGAIAGYAVYNYILFGYLHYVVHRPFHQGNAHRSGWWYRPLRVALVWTAYEYLKSVGFLGYPWGLVAYPLAVWLPVAQGAELAGVWGLSFLAAWVNVALAEVIHRREPAVLLCGADSLGADSRGAFPRAAFLRSDGARHLVAAALTILVVAGFGTVRLHQFLPDPHGKSLRILVVQQNIDSWQPGRFSDALERAQRLTITTMAEHEQSGEPPVDFILWSETTLRRPYRQNDGFYRTTPEALPFTAFLSLAGRPLVTGAPMPVDDEGLDYTNSALVIAPDGTLLGEYAKQQLVPFAESIPFWEVPAVQNFFREAVGVFGTWRPGGESTVIEIPLGKGGSGGPETIPVGLPICFEDGFGWVPREMVRNGARVLVNLTNNSWSRQDSAQTQHYVAARLRSIELRTPLVRGTNSGLSGVVDQRGVLTQELPMFVSTATVMTVPVVEPPWTLYHEIGDLPGQLAVVAVLVYIVTGSLRRRRS